MSALANKAAPPQARQQPNENGIGWERGPAISLETLDGPTQRVYATSLFIALEVSCDSEPLGSLVGNLGTRLKAYG